MMSVADGGKTWTRTRIPPFKSATLYYRPVGVRLIAGTWLAGNNDLDKIHQKFEIHHQVKV